MAIKILKMGNPPEKKEQPALPPKVEKVYKHTCPKCKTIFEAAKSDRYTFLGSRMGEGGVFIDCPVCREAILIKVFQ
jgi:ssDNA-binding Zn-finger/Zn-ribbon topoisomerase 1